MRKKKERNRKKRTERKNVDITDGKENKGIC